MKKVRIRTTVTKLGFDLYTNKRKYSFNYPQNVWSSFPLNLREVLAQNLTVFFTRHFAFWKNYRLEYEFPPPIFESLFLHGVLFSLPETTIEFEQYKHTTSKLIQRFINTQFQISYTGQPRLISTRAIKTDAAIVLIPFTFGKDSLLTYVLCKKIGLTAKLFFIAEPLSAYENIQRAKFYQDFARTTGDKIIVIKNTWGWLRQKAREMWGWDMLQMQYAALLIPYAFKFKANYLFFANEQNTNEIEKDNEGYTANLYFEQSEDWMLRLNHLYRHFGLPTGITSIISPIYELMVTYILHKQFPQIAKFQISCQGDSSLSKTKRWCGVCNECARMYLFLRAIGVDPETVGFKEDLLDTKRYDIFHIFSKTTLAKQNKSEVIFYYGEWLLAFLLAYKKRASGHLINLFKKFYLPDVLMRKNELINRYLKIYSLKNLPPEIKQPLHTVYQQAVKSFRKEIIADF